ncbi:MAG: hypothetical protein J5526_06305 [Bacteroidales bacterium]|nr:hypothetical protein [Bacteroidales bacterium]
MEKRIGTITLLVSDRSQSESIKHLISDFSDIILCRQGLPLLLQEVFWWQEY